MISSAVSSGVKPSAFLPAKYPVFTSLPKPNVAISIPMLVKAA